MTHVEISESRIWQKTQREDKTVYSPLIRKGYVDPALREVDRRMFCDEVYQVGLRGVARNWTGDAMDIIVFAPRIDYVIPLQSVLHGADIRFGAGHHEPTLRELATDYMRKGLPSFAKMVLKTADRHGGTMAEAKEIWLELMGAG